MTGLLTPLQRIEKRTRRLDNGCLEWTGSIDDNGHGIIRIDRKRYRVIRFLYQRKYGAIPPKMLIFHFMEPPECIGNACVELEHARLATSGEVLRDRGWATRKARPKH